MTQSSKEKGKDKMAASNGKSNAQSLFGVH